MKYIKLVSYIIVTMIFTISIGVLYDIGNVSNVGIRSAGVACCSGLGLFFFGLICSLLTNWRDQ